MKVRKLSFAFVALLIAGGVSASPTSGWYAGVGAGQTKAKEVKCSDDYSAVFADTTCKADDTDTGFKVFVGNQVNQNAAFEFGWVDLGKATINGTDSVFGTTKGTWEADGFYFAGMGFIPVGTAASFFGKIGLFKWSADLTIDTSIGSASDDDSGMDLLLGLGALFNLSPAVALRLEWERFADVGDDSTVGQSDVDMLSGSILFRF